MTPADRIEALALAPGLVVGAPRSGTTWLQRLLLHHPGTCGGQETHWLAQLDELHREARRKFEMPRPHGVLCHLDEEGLLDSLRRTWIAVSTAVVTHAPDAVVLIEKTPDHALHLDFANRLLPACRVIHVLRHPEAVVASLLTASEHDWGRPWAPRSVDAAARRWVSCVESARASAAVLGPDRYLEIRYAALRAAPTDPLRACLAFLDLPFDEAWAADAVAAETRDRESPGSGTPLRLHGEGAGRLLEEPFGFHREGPRRRLGPLERRRCHRITGALARSLDLEPEPRP